MINIRKLESELWESADLLRAGSKLTSNQYCMPVLGLIFLRYACGDCLLAIEKTLILCGFQGFFREYAPVFLAGKNVYRK